MKKTSLFISISFSIIFVLIGYNLYFNLSFQPEINNPIFLKVTGIACMVFFGLISLFGIKKLISE